MDVLRGIFDSTRFQQAIQTAWSIALTCFVLLVLAHVVVGLSMVVYFLFYWLYVPVAVHSWPLHFDFSGSSLHLPSQLPSTSVHLVTQQGYGAFANRQGYNFYVELEVPDHEHNNNLGMFMVTLILTPGRPPRQDLSAYNPGATQDVVWLGNELRTSRAASLKYASWPIRLARQAALLMPMVLGIWAEEQHFRVPLTTDVFNSSDRPFEWAQVVLSERDIHVNSARLVAHAHMTGLTYLMFNWFFSSFIVGTYSTAVVISSALLVMYLLLRPSETTGVVAVPVAAEPVETEPTLNYRRLAEDPRVAYDADSEMFVFKPKDQPPVDLPELPLQLGEPGADGDVIVQEHMPEPDQALRRRALQREEDEVDEAPETP